MTGEEILARLLEDARSIWPDFPTSRQQMDPVVHMMFKAFAEQFKAINDKINNISDSIINDLACRIFFDGLLHPVPASAILKFTTGSSVTNADILTEACWVNTSLQPSTTFYFSPVETKELHPVEAVFALSLNNEGMKILWTNPSWEGRGEFLGQFESAPGITNGLAKDYVYISLKPMSADITIPEDDIFVRGSSALLEYLRWSRWRFTGLAGAFGEPVVPGFDNLRKTLRKQSVPELSLWGHNYYPFEHKDDYQDYLFSINKGEAGNTPSQLAEILPDQAGGILDNLGPLYWIQIESDKKIPQNDLDSFDLVATNCAVCLNAHYLKQSYFYRGPGPMEIVPQNKANEIFEIAGIHDNHGRSYSNVYVAPGDGENQCRYIPRIDGSQFKLIVIPPNSGKVPDRLSVEYRISAGEAANGIEAGLINSLYNPYPGIESVINLTTTKGGTAARSFTDMIKAFPNVLRSHNRAVIATDFESLAVSFDKRIISAKATIGSIERGGVLRGCVELAVEMGNYHFNLEQEAELFLGRLARYLEMRSPVGTIVSARIIE